MTSGSEKLLAGFQNRTAPSSAGPLRPQSYGAGMADSFLASFPELVGIEPDLDVQRWRVENPAGGITSQLLGYGVPYLGWWKAAGKIPKMKRALDKIEKAGGESRPILTGAAKNVTRMAPFEGGRVLGAVALGGDVEDTAYSALAGLGIEGVLGGLGGMIRAYGKNSKRLQGHVPGLKLDDPWQKQARVIREELPKVAPKHKPFVEGRMDELSRLIRAEKPAAGKGYVGSLEVGGTVRRRGPTLERVQDGQQLNKLFQPGSWQGGTTRRLIVGKGGFSSAKRRDDFINQAKLPENWLDYAQFPRVVTAVAKEGDHRVANVIREGLEDVGNGWRWGKEADEGAYILARQVDERAWLTLKTDNPAAFLPKRQEWARRVVKENALQGSTMSARGDKIPGVGVWNNLLARAEQFPVRDFIDLSGAGTTGARLGAALAKKVGMDGIVDSELANVSKGIIREYFAPTMAQFTDSPRASWILRNARAAYDETAAEAEAIWAGTAKIKKDGNLFSAIVEPRVGQGGMKPLLDSLDDSDMLHVWKAWREGLSPEEAARFASPKAQRFLERAAQEDKKLAEKVLGVNKAIGKSDFNPLANHFAISRTWAGSWRKPVYNESGSMVYMAAGRNKNEAEQVASRVLERAKAGGRAWTSKPLFQSERDGDLIEAARINVTSDYKRAAKFAEASGGRLKSFKKRKGIGGYAGADAPWTKKELGEIYSGHINRTYSWLAENSVKEVMGGQLQALAGESSRSYGQLLQRLDDLAGKQGPLGRVQNDLLDKVLAPALGKNSATKIVGVANTLAFNFQLGMGNLAFPVLNALTFTQTVLPQASFVMTATPARVARYYSHWPAAGSDGLAHGAVSSINPLKLMSQSMREMGKPDEVLRHHFQKAGQEGVWDPRMVEEFVGKNAGQILNFKSVLKGDQGYVEWMKNVSEFLPGMSEKFARGNAFAVGHIIGRDFMRLQEDALYTFAKEFTQNTMYLYGASDRARLITGPVGSLFGMFKNWQMHYMSQMLEYTGEAALRGNWKPLLWQTGGTAAVGGVAGTPVWGVADAMSEWMTDKSAMEHLFEAWPAAGNDFTGGSDTIYLGLPALLGVSLQASASAPGSDPARDAGCCSALSTGIG